MTQVSWRCICKDIIIGKGAPARSRKNRQVYRRVAFNSVPKAADEAEGFKLKSALRVIIIK
jgi:hypothetical protein